MERHVVKTKTTKSTARKLSAPTSPLPAPQAFTAGLFANLLPEDVASLSPALRQDMAASIWHLARKREHGAVNLRFFNLNEQYETIDFDRAILNIVGDDMPFLVESVTNELQKRGLTVHLTAHPVHFVRRDAEGCLLDLDGHRSEAESFIHMHCDRIADADMRLEIEESLRTVLADVRNVVSDWPEMQRQTKEIIGEIFTKPAATVPVEEIEETRLFLDWLGDRNFTFLGYCALELVLESGDVRWKISSGTTLGILRREADRLFGRLFDLKTQHFMVRSILKQKRLVLVTQTNLRSHVHRAAPMVAIFVQRFNDKGAIVGEHLFLGLFTSACYQKSPFDVPFLRHKVTRVVARAKHDPDSHDGRALLYLLDTYPHDELFQIEEDDLFDHAIGIVQLQERVRVALFLRKDPFGRFMTCLLYVPREMYDTHVRQLIQHRIEDAFAGRLTNLKLRVDDSPLACVFMTIEVERNRKPPDRAALEADLRMLCRSWPDRLRDALRTAFGETRMLELDRRYGEAFPPAYCDATSTEDAVRDIAALERVQTEAPFIVELSAQDSGLLHLKLFQLESPLVLSDILPLIENMGLAARRMGGPYEVVPCDDSPGAYIHEFFCEADREQFTDIGPLKALFEEAFGKVYIGEAENDTFNALTLSAGLAWRDVMMLRTLARYLRQLRVPYEQEMIAATLIAHPGTVRDLVDLFFLKHDPDVRGDRAKPMAWLIRKINATLDSVKVLEEDRIIRRYKNLIESSLRTNYFQRTPNGEPKPYLSIKFDSRAIDFMPLPKPLFEIFVYSPRVEAVHLRGGKIARGGIRWSDRREDFRNEILGLMKAQMVKNSVIVPVGSKGGFIVKQPPQNQSGIQTEAVGCYMIFMRGLLDLTDNLANGLIEPPPRVVRHDEDDPYLVVAADKGTATFSDIANAISQEYGFWLDDAFASGGSAGYDHKGMGITARGVWEGVKRHFRELGKDIQKTDFTCIAVGDMSGDVFGNGMLLSKHTRLIAAFDHRHIFCDPAADSAVGFAERQRLFGLPHCTWTDYDRSKISTGGGVFPRSEKTIKLTPEIKKAFSISANSLTPNELIQAMLRSKVDLMYFAGIGTYVKAASETNSDVRDRANDPVRIDGCELQAGVVGEGANLGMSQRGRMEYALKGGRLNTDAIDNSAGVSTSDREVNLKILLNKLVKSGDLSLAARNDLLAGMTDDVAHLVLRDNYRQTQALSVAESRAVELLSEHAQCILFLEKTGFLNRAVEFLPDQAEIAERRRVGRGLTRPELSVLLAYAKLWLYEEVLASDLPDDEFLHKDLMYYFPDLLTQKYAHEISHHQLRREIVATRLANSLINRVGSHFVFAVAEQTAARPAAIVRAYHLVRAVFRLHALWKEIESLDNRVAAQTQIAMLNTVNRMMDRVVPWFLKEKEVQAKLESAIALYKDGVERLADWLSKNPAAIGEGERRSEHDLARQGISKRLAHRMAIMPYLAVAPELTWLTAKSDSSIEEAATVFFGLGERLGLENLHERITKLIGPDTPWQRQAVALLLGEIHDSQRKLVACVLALKAEMKKKTYSMDELLLAWIARNAQWLERYDTLLDEIGAVGNLDISMLSLANRYLSSLAK